MELSSDRQLNVLIVEDDGVTARDIEAILHRRGFAVSGIAGSHAEAKELVERIKPDLALVDIHLQNADAGVELATELREKHGVSVVFVTGYSEDAVYEQANAAKPAAFIRKPFSDAELTACLNAVAERGVAVEELAAKLPGIIAIAEELSEAVIVADREGNVAYLNTAAANLTGWSHSEACDKPQGDVVRLIDTNGDVKAIQNRSGGQVEVSERSSAIRSDEGEVVGLMTILSPEPGTHPGETPVTGSASSPETPDPEAPRENLPPARADALKKIAALSSDPAFRELISQRKSDSIDSGVSASSPSPTNEEREDDEPESTTSPLIDNVTDPLVKINKAGQVTYANSEASALFGNGKNLVGLSFWDRFSTAEFEEYDEPLHRPLATGRRSLFEFNDSSRGLWFEVRSYRTEDGVLALFTDITSGKQEDAESLRQQRLEGLGLLARGFAHDFNNRLTAITGNISLARERQQEDLELQNLLGEAQSAAAHATGLVHQLMTFAQGGRPIRKQTRISDLIRRILTEHRIQHPDIRYQFQGADPELIANIDPAQISRLVENLIANSALAMTQGGILIVRTARISPLK